jgi:HNH endonuclease/Bacterial regulatory proteins, luxR family
VLPLHHSPTAVGEDSHPTTRDRVAALLFEGKSITEIARELGISKPTVCFHKRRLGYEMDGRFGQRYDWDQIQAYYDEGHTARACRERFGCSAWSWSQAVGRGALVPRPRQMPPDELFVVGTRRDRGHLKERLRQAGLLPDACEECGMSEWRGESLPLELHHINGDRDDNRLDNLQLICPNCHAITPNWGGRGAKLKRAA